jgi:phenylpropionate dioxygenase-like ring-hydroxylating dioxygenase large terminal subunit
MLDHQNHQGDLRFINTQTQPLSEMNIFNNWDAVPKGWYAICKVEEVKTSKAKSFYICGQRVVLYRNSENQVFAMDSFCPHMGLDLALGKVEGSELRCKFHGWKFNQEGQLSHIPCGEKSDREFNLNAYAVEEQYGYIWIYPDKVAPEPVFVPAQLKGKALIYWRMEPLSRACHPHVPMINGIDAQHVKAVHDIDMVPHTQVFKHAANTLEFYLESLNDKSTFLKRLMSKLLGPVYAYSNVFVDGTLALLNTMKKVKLFNRYEVEECYLIFSLRYHQKGHSSIVPIAIAEKKKGLLPLCYSYFMLILTVVGFETLKSDEGEEFFKDIRFRADNLLPHFDKPISTLIGFINRQELSKWSRNHDKR